VLKTEIISQKPYTSGEGFGIIIKARVKVDTSMLSKRVKKLMGDRTAMEQLSANRKREKALLIKIERLEETNRGLAKKKETQAVKKKREELEKDFHQTIKMLDAVALNDLALELWKDGKYSNPRKAIEILNKAVELDPGYAMAYNNKGTAYAVLKEYIKAIQNFDKAIELDPGYAMAYRSRGLGYAYLNQHIKAIDDFDRLIALKPGNASGYHNRGVSYIKLELFSQGCSDLKKACELGECKGWKLAIKERWCN